MGKETRERTGIVAFRNFLLRPAGFIQPFLLILALPIFSCKEPRKEISHSFEDDFSNRHLPNGILFQVYGKMYGRPKIEEGQIIVYLNSWMSGERRYIVSRDSIVVTNPIGKTLYECNLIPNPDSNSEEWIARPARPTDSLPDVKFKSYIIRNTRLIHDSLASMGLDTMRSPRKERWDCHENRFYIVESFLDGRFNMFQFTLTDLKRDSRYRWIDKVFMSIDPGKDERARYDKSYQ